MNPLTKVKLINELNEREADLGVKETVSWHSAYKDSAWIFVGGFPYELTEGDIICVFSQYGEIVNINLVRDKKTGKSKGFCFICYEDQRSTILAVDNFNGIKIKGRTIRVDHVSNYRPPKDSEDIDDVTKQLREKGCAPKLPSPSSSSAESEEEYAIPVKKQKKDKKEKKKKKKEKKEKKKASKERRDGGAGSSPSPPIRVKKEKEDSGYEKYSLQGAQEDRRPRGERSGQEVRNAKDRAEEGANRERHGDERIREREKNREDEKRRERMTDAKRPTNHDAWQRENRDRDREKERERDREKEREREVDRERERDRDRDRERNRNSEL
ncbi:RNA-binding motif protein, X-linked 2, partial [Chanos chanos]|uniref:RNA-binding motif protein, X-linked 2 n=1 Tax=Chanos chanos TaxID=29144 RepID=A0A6J2WYB7_CHACN